jgi:hypothetical protein
VDLPFGYFFKNEIRKRLENEGEKEPFCKMGLYPPFCKEPPWKLGWETNREEIIPLETSGGYETRNFLYFSYTTAAYVAVL